MFCTQSFPHATRSSSSPTAGMHCQAATIFLRSLVCRGTGVPGATNARLSIQRGEHVFGRVCILPNTGSDQPAKIELLSQMYFIGILEAAGLETAQNYFQTRITIGKAKRERGREFWGHLLVDSLKVVFKLPC